MYSIWRDGPRWRWQTGPPASARGTTWTKGAAKAAALQSIKVRAERAGDVAPLGVAGLDVAPLDEACTSKEPPVTDRALLQIHRDQLGQRRAELKRALAAFSDRGGTLPGNG